MEKKRGAKDSENVEMKDRPLDLSGYEDEDDAPVVAPPTTKKRAAPRSAARAGKNSRPAKTPTTPGDVS